MANTSEYILNSTLDVSSPLEDCLKGKSFAFMFSYVITAICFLFGTPAHLICLWIYFCTEQKIKESQVFLLNYTIMELLFSLECGMDALNMFIFENDTLWYVSYFFFGLSWTGRPLLQTCICIEQYLAVLHPVTFLRFKHIKYRNAATVLVWLIGFGYGVYEISALNFPDMFYTFVFMIALVVISFCCVSVLCVLKQPGPGDTHITKQATRDGGNQQKRNAFNIIFSAMLLILFTYLPQALLIIFNPDGEQQLLFDCTISPLMTSLNVLGVIISPLLKLYNEFSRIVRTA